MAAWVVLAHLEPHSFNDWKALARSVATYLKLEASIFYNQDGPVGRKYALLSVGTLSSILTYLSLDYFMNPKDE